MHRLSIEQFFGVSLNFEIDGPRILGGRRRFDTCTNGPNYSRDTMMVLDHITILWLKKQRITFWPSLSCRVLDRFREAARFATMADVSGDWTVVPVGALQKTRMGASGPDPSGSIQ